MTGFLSWALLTMSILRRINDKLCLRRTTVPWSSSASRILLKTVARAQHVDTASDGRPVRLVVVLPFKETDSIQAEIDKWTLMARELEQYPDLNIPKTILYPVPNILRGGAQGYNLSDRL